MLNIETSKNLSWFLHVQGVLEFFENIREEYPNPRMGRWFVPGSRHYSWDKVKNILYNVPGSRHYSWDKVKNILYNIPSSRHYSWDKVRNILYNVPGSRHYSWDKVKNILL